MKKKAASVDEYLAGVPEPARGTLERVRVAIRQALPKEATERLSWGMPAFHHRKTVVAYAPFKKHCSFFPMSGAVIGQFGEELAKYECSKGAIRFPLDKPLPSTLVKKLVKARLAEIGE